MGEFQRMTNFIKSAIPAKGWLIPCVAGPVGIGKTAAGLEVCRYMKEKGIGTGHMVKIVASQILPNEVSGITMPVAETKAMEIFDHYRLSSLQDGDMLFFDELLEADELVLSACLTLLESREMMSGRKLPNILIVAATNLTVKPDRLKENIRQRFIWRQFKLDQNDCREYIKATVGFDVGADIAAKLTCEGNNYNILTPRSLTSMARWTASAADIEQANMIEESINACWNSQLGTMLRQRWEQRVNNPMVQVQRALKDVVSQRGYQPTDFRADVSATLFGEGEFKASDLNEVMEVLQNLPDWDKIADQLGRMEMAGSNNTSTGVNF